MSVAIPNGMATLKLETEESQRTLLEVDACGDLADTRIVGLGKEPGWVSQRISAGRRSCIGSTKPCWTAPLRRVEDVEELATDLETLSFPNGELLEERKIDQRVKLLANLKNRTVGLGCVSQALNEGRVW